MKHVMIDLETYGTSPGCVLRSLGAVEFCPDLGIGKEFYCNFQYEDQQTKGAFIHLDTKTWWEKQSQKAQDDLLIDQKPFYSAIKEFCAFFKGTYVWSQGSTFDISILEHSMSLFHIKPPWKFWDIRDTRTAYHMAKFDTRSIKRQGTYHNALDDAKHQASCVIESYRKLKS
jgi:hypothetical protein